eukprot:3936508-Rhodomonas_salina.1
MPPPLLLPSDMLLALDSDIILPSDIMLPCACIASSQDCSQSTIEHNSSHGPSGSGNLSRSHPLCLTPELDPPIAPLPLALELMDSADSDKPLEPD